MWLVFWAGIGPRGASYPEIEADVEASVEVTAEDGLEILLSFRPLEVGYFGKCFGDLIIFNAVVLEEVLVESVDSVVETALPGKKGRG